MKKTKLTTLIIALIMLLSISSTALATSFEDFTDVSGHWAEETLKKAHADALLEGFEDNTLKPDDPITLPQMLTVITRVLNATQMVSLDSLGDKADKWYSEAVAKSLYLGILDENIPFSDGVATRQNAMAIIARAFSLIPAQPDYSALNAFADSSYILDPNKPAMAALVASGLVQGSGNSLNVNGSITRGEFITILYRIVQNYVDPVQFNSGLLGGSLIRGSASLYGITTTENIWFDCKAENVSLSSVSAKNLTLRSHRLTSLNLSTDTSLTRLVVDSGSYNLSLPTGSGSKIGTLQLSGKGTATIGDNGIQNIEVTGNGVTLNLSGSHENLIVAGVGNTVELSEGAKITNLTILGSGNKVFGSRNESEASTDSFTPTTSIENIIVNGSGNHFGMSTGLASCKTINISGTKNTGAILIISPTENVTLGGSGNSLEFYNSFDLNTAKVDGDNNQLSLACANVASMRIDGGANHVVNESNVPSLILAGENNAFTSIEKGKLGDVEVRGKNNKLTVDGTASHILISGGGGTIDGKGLSNLITVKAKDCKITLKATTLDNSFLNDTARVLKLVTSPYKGNYTLKYAQDHDYEDFEKEIFVNAKGYSSKTEYLIWLNLATQRTNIFKGSRENWKLVRSSIVATGAPSTPTPVGIWTTTYKQAAGWTTSTYTCKPVVRFKPNTGYAFHSRLYYPNSNKLTDASIGFPVSQGCVRMYDEDIKYIFDTIPSNTTVVVF